MRRSRTITSASLAALLLTAGIPAWSRGGEVDDAGPRAKPLTLLRCLEMAGTESLEIRETRQKLRSAQIEYEDTTGFDWPTVSAAVDYVYKDTYNEGEPDPIRPYLSASQTSINDWNKVQRSRSAATRLFQEKLALEKMLFGARVAAGEKYFDVLQAQELVELGRSRVQRKARGLEEMENRFRLGLIPEMDIL
ncbi:MAG: TolC family protein, partial [bacterium]